MNISGPYRITHSHAIKKEKRVALFSVYCAESLNFILNMEADRKCKLTDMTSMTFLLSTLSLSFKIHSEVQTALKTEGKQIRKTMFSS